MRQLDIGYEYRCDVVAPDGSPETDLPGCDHVASAAPDRRAPHLWVTVDGARKSTLDLVGPEPVLPTGSRDGWYAPAGRLGVTAHALSEAA